MNKQFQRGLIAAGALASMASARAAAGDVDVSAVTAAGTQVALVGAAVFTVVVGIKVWKWIRGAL